MGRQMGALFDEEPHQWGLRGDPHVWRAMRERLGSQAVPSDPAEAERVLVETFEDLLGIDLVRDRPPEGRWQVYREEFAHGGMSSGVVDVSTWLDRLLPLLVARAGGDAAPGS